MVVAVVLAALQAVARMETLAPHDAVMPPVHITSCRTVVEPRRRRTAAQEAISVSFANDSNLLADVALFSVRSTSGVWRAFTARGSFSKGILIADRILTSESASQQSFFGRRRSADCVLTYVHFADGSSWTAPR